MSYKSYSNFVKSTAVSERSYSVPKSLTGEEAKQEYLKEVKDVNISESNSTIDFNKPTEAKVVKCTIDPQSISNKDLFLSAQNNDVDTLKIVLDKSPDKINVLDEFGWSLLMIACQENSVDAVKELLKRGIDTSTRDKAGNSASTLVIRNKNVILADLLLNHKEKVKFETKTHLKAIKSKLKSNYFCHICNGSFIDKNVHVASTIHNINASKGRKIPSNFKIPESNKGYQLMLKDGWDRESGLGPKGSGKKYPIKTVQKIDKKGLGHKKDKRKTEVVEESKKYFNKLTCNEEQVYNRKMEINFRRQFY